MFCTSVNIKSQNENMFDIGCVTCGYRITEDSKTALSDDLQYIIIAVECINVITRNYLKY